MENKFLEISKRLLNVHINFMFEEGDVDGLFHGLLGRRTKYDVDQLAKKIKSYCVEVKREISKLNGYSKPPKVDFAMACKMARSIKARSIWIGAKNVRLSCVFVIEACLDQDEEDLSNAVLCLSKGFERTRRNFEEYLEMEHEIAEKEEQLEEANK